MVGAGFVVVRERAKPMSPEERRASILDAVIPLLTERGRGVSTRELAEAAGIAEGTLFRAFGDKEALFAAAIDRITDPGPFRASVRAIDPDDPTERKVRQLVALFVDRFSGIVGFMTAMAVQPGPPPSAEDFRRSTWYQGVDRLFRPGELAVSTEVFAFYVRLLAFGSAIPAFTQNHPFTADQLADLVLGGVLPAPRKE